MRTINPNLATAFQVAEDWDDFLKTKYQNTTGTTATTVPTTSSTPISLTAPTTTSNSTPNTNTTSTTPSSDASTLSAQIQKAPTEFRNYTAAASVKPSVVEFYRENHRVQTLQSVLEKKALYGSLNNFPEMSIWEAMEMLNKFVDVSDPDTNLSQIQHLLQVSFCLFFA